MWILDDKICLDAVATEAKWHLRTTQDALRRLGVSPHDAVAFADFIFCDYDKTPRAADECLTDSQWDRLAFKRHD